MVCGPYVPVISPEQRNFQTNFQIPLKKFFLSFISNTLKSVYLFLVNTTRVTVLFPYMSDSY